MGLKLAHSHYAQSPTTRSTIVWNLITSWDCTTVLIPISDDSSLCLLFLTNSRFNQQSSKLQLGALKQVRFHAVSLWILSGNHEATETDQALLESSSSFFLEIMNEHAICKNVWYLSIWPYSWALCVFLASSKSGAASQQTIILLLLNLRCWRRRPPRNWSWWENFRFFSSTPPPPLPPLPGCCCGNLKHSSSCGGHDDDATTRADLELHASSGDTIEAFNANNSIKTVVLEARSKLWQRRGIQLFLCLARYRFFFCCCAAATTAKEKSLSFLASNLLLLGGQSRYKKT